MCWAYDERSFWMALKVPSHLSLQARLHLESVDTFSEASQMLGTEMCKSTRFCVFLRD